MVPVLSFVNCSTFSWSVLFTLSRFPAWLVPYSKFILGPRREINLSRKIFVFDFWFLPSKRCIDSWQLEHHMNYQGLFLTCSSKSSHSTKRKRARIFALPNFENGLCLVIANAFLCWNSLDSLDFLTSMIRGRLYHC